ncbi:vacuolar protein sorting-associated protein 54-like isoform X1 [Dreissena polymorpha]|uniref:vacuolar protein sorting-associated protein 54-like isoform X1 n=1 Tax=Dreissena polymorpha TaxID=45954 RepID=UPI002264AE2D|nr:vacuolar protein sorting-associated protein 54-like isoform X1 [Dreissena polymorpha]
MSKISVNNHIPNWTTCNFCTVKVGFKAPREFCRHLRDFHCTREGGSYICRYGKNNVCPSLPLDGVSDLDYEEHIMRDHVNQNSGRNSNMSALQQLHSNAQRAPPNSEPSVVEDQHKWTVFNSKVNLPAALNDPRLLKRETDFFTKTWGVDFYEKPYLPMSPHVQEINWSHFESYVRQTSGRYKKHNKQLQSLSEKNESQLTKTVRQAEKNRTELEQIPKLFLMPNFNLENPDTFSAVFPWTQVEESKIDQPGARHSSKLLQEKLSHYLDIVEVQIAQQISRRSEAFFHAMASHDVLQEKMKATCARIKYLRDKMHQMDAMMARGSLKVVKMTQSRSNYVKLHNKLKLMSTVHQTQPTIQTLLSTNEFMGALDLISTTQEVLSQELAGVHCLRHLSSQLAEMKKLIEIMINEEFLKLVTSELNRPITDLVTLVDEEKLVAILFGILRLKKLDFLNDYQEETFRSMKAVVKQTVIEAICAAETIESDSSLADQMRLLNYSQWIELMETIFNNMLIILQRAKAFSGIVSDVVGIAAGKTKVPTPINSPTQDMANPLEEPKHLNVSVSEDVDVMITMEDHGKVMSDLRQLLFFLSDHANDRCMKVVQAQGKEGFLERLSPTEFVSLSHLVEKFNSDCEELCGRKSMSLRGCLLSHATRFINRFHEERKTKLSCILDNERWKQADVPIEFQDLVQHISNSGQLTLPDRKSEKDRKPGECLMVDGEQFAVVGTVLMLLKMVVEYCQCAEDIPSVTPDLLSRLIELLNMFNSRTCQLVLGAGALELVGLKTISTKNLALASRCLQLVVFYMPKIRAHFECKLPNKSATMLKHFDAIVKDYKGHVEEISNKLVTIMESMVDTQISRWEVKAPMPSSCFRAICKQMAKLHEAIIDILPQDQIKSIFFRINQTFKNVLRQKLTHLNVINNGGPQHGLVTSDLTFYAGSFKTLRGLEELAQDVKDVWDKR